MQRHIPVSSISHLARFRLRGAIPNRTSNYSFGVSKPELRHFVAPFFFRDVHSFSFEHGGEFLGIRGIHCGKGVSVYMAIAVVWW
jgi:hypothetical protein